MMATSWFAESRQRVRWLRHGARACSVWFALCALDAAPEGSERSRSFHATAMWVLAPLAAPLVTFIEALALAIRRHTGVWW